MARQHARYSPSRLGALEKCPRFQYRERDGAVSGADEGSLMHKAREEKDLSILETEEQRVQVQKCLDYIDSIRAGMPEDTVEMNEVKLTFKDYTYGFGDAILVSPSALEAHVFDTKMGRKGAEDADTNMQLCAYSGAILTMGLMVNGELVIPKKVTAHLVSPRTGEVTDFTYTSADVDAMETRIRKIISNANNPFTPPCPHPDLCTNCAWSHCCPALNAMVTQAVQSALPAISFPGTLVVNPKATPDEKGRMLAAFDVLADAIEQGQKVLKEDALTTEVVPTGYQVCQRAGSAKIVTPGVAFEILTESGLLTEDEIKQEAMTLSVPNLIKLYVAKAQTKDDREAHRERILDTLAPVLERGADIRYLQRKRNFDQKKFLTVGTPTVI